MNFYFNCNGRNVDVDLSGTSKTAEDESEEKFENVLRFCLEEYCRNTGLAGIEKATVKRFFGSGKSGARVFLMDFFGKDDKQLYRRIFKFDRSFAIRQEKSRFNTFCVGMSKKIVPDSKLVDHGCGLHSQYRLLEFSYAGMKAQSLSDLLSFMLKLLTEKSRDHIKHDVLAVLDQVLNELFRHSYLLNDAAVPAHESYEFLQSPSSCVDAFCNIFPPEWIIDETRPSDSNRREFLDAMLFDIEEISQDKGQSVYKKKYIVKNKGRFSRADVITLRKPTESEEQELVEKPPGKKLRQIAIREGCDRRRLEDRLGQWIQEAGLDLDAAMLRTVLNTKIVNPLSSDLLHYDLNPNNILVVKKKKETRGVLIDFSTFNRGGHLFIDLARLEGLILVEYALEAWKEDLADTDKLGKKVRLIEQAIFYAECTAEGLSDYDRDIVDISLHIRRIGLRRFRDRNGDIKGDHFRNYILARYAFLLSFQKISKDVVFLVEKKRLALLFAHELARLIEEEDDLDYSSVIDKFKPRRRICERVVSTFLVLLVSLCGASVFTKICAVDLRGTPSYLSNEDVETILREKGFFCCESKLFPKLAGSFENDFVRVEKDGASLVRDRKTGLCWLQDERHGMMSSFDQAARKIEDMRQQRYAGYDDWRIPTLEELASLISDEKHQDRRYLDKYFTLTDRAWTCDRRINEKGMRTDQRWLVLFSNGTINYKSTIDRPELMAVRTCFDYEKFWFAFFAVAYIMWLLASVLQFGRFSRRLSNRICRILKR